MDEIEALEGGAPEGPSKSQIKRELLALQDLAEQLTMMPRSELERLGLSEATGAAIDESAKIKDQRARRRHFKHIAKLLAGEGREAIRALVDEKAENAREAAARHHRVARWRERLIEEGDDALTELLDLCPHADRQQLRRLMRVARREREQGRPDAARKLFRLLREIMGDTDLS